MGFNWGNALTSGLGGALGGAATGAKWGSMFGLPGTMIGAGIGGLAGFFGGGQDPYQKTGQASDVSQANPYTDPFMQQLSGQGRNFYNQLNAGTDRLQSMIGALDPLAAQREFINNGAGAMRGIAAANMDPFANQQRAQYLSNQALRNIGTYFGNQGPGAGRSGAAQAAMMEGALNPFTQMNQNLANMQTQQAGALQQANMGQLFNSYLQNAGMGLQAQGGQNQLLGNLYGNVLGQQGAVAAPEWWQPTYLNNPAYSSPTDWMNVGIKGLSTLIKK